MTESLIISYSQAHGDDIACIIVRANNNGAILSSFYGEEATSLYEKLTGLRERDIIDAASYAIIKKDLYERLAKLSPVNPKGGTYLTDSSFCRQCCEFGTPYKPQPINVNSDMLIGEISDDS